MARFFLSLPLVMVCALCVWPSVAIPKFDNFTAWYNAFVGGCYMYSDVGSSGRCATHGTSGKVEYYSDGYHYKVETDGTCLATSCPGGTCLAESCADSGFCVCSAFTNWWCEGGTETYLGAVTVDGTSCLGWTCSKSGSSTASYYVRQSDGAPFKADDPYTRTFMSYGAGIADRSVLTVPARCRNCDAFPCINGGVCVANNTCACPSGWGGPGCGTFACDKCVHGQCVASNMCRCADGWSGTACDNSAASISLTATTISFLFVCWLAVVLGGP